VENGDGQMMHFAFQLLIFPGLLFVFAGSQAAAFLERKTAARMQNRIGPSLFQPFHDIFKLLVKENEPPDVRQKGTPLLFPFMGLVSAACFSFLVWRSVFHPTTGFRGDFFALVILSAAASLLQVSGVLFDPKRAASGGGNRFFNYYLTAELPFFIAAGVPFLQAGGAFRMGELAAFQKTYGAVVASASGFLAFAAAFTASFVVIRLSPFNQPDTGIEALSGPPARCSGMSLAVFQLTRQIMLFTIPAMLILFFLGGMPFGGFAGFPSAAKYLAVSVAFSVIQNLSPTLGLSRALRFCLGPLTFLSVCAVVLSFLGW
jgi:NADH-quinone oxidoreductase subunit H